MTDKCVGVEDMCEQNEFVLPQGHGVGGVCRENTVKFFWAQKCNEGWFLHNEKYNERRIRLIEYEPSEPDEEQYLYQRYDRDFPDTDTDGG